MASQASAGDPLKIILVIDDHDDGREALALLLAHFGYTCIGAKTSNEALDFLDKGLKPCAIFLDLLMPGDGWHFRARQMEHPEWSKIPVVVGTGIGRRPEGVAPDLDIPREHYLLKPFDPEELLAILGRVCPPPG